MKPNRVDVISNNMVNFGPPSTAPEKLKARKVYRHNPTVTLMHTTVVATEHR